MIATTRSAAAVMADGGLDDDIKEREIRTASKRLMGRFVEITARTAVLLAVPAVTLLGFDALGLAPLDEVVAFLLRWDVVLAAMIAMVAVGALRW